MCNICIHSWIGSRCQVGLTLAVRHAGGKSLVADFIVSIFLLSVPQDFKLATFPLGRLIVSYDLSFTDLSVLGGTGVYFPKNIGNQPCQNGLKWSYLALRWAILEADLVTMSPREAPLGASWAAYPGIGKS